MKQQHWDRSGWAEELLRQPGIADAVAETLLVHQHECFARVAVQHVLAALGTDEATFIHQWALGNYDA